MKRRLYHSDSDRSHFIQSKYNTECSISDISLQNRTLIQYNKLEQRYDSSYSILLNQFSNIPDEIILLIWQFLSDHDHTVLSFVCHRFIINGICIVSKENYLFKICSLGYLYFLNGHENYCLGVKIFVAVQHWVGI